MKKRVCVLTMLLLLTISCAPPLTASSTVTAAPAPAPRMTATYLPTETATALPTATPTSAPTQTRVPSPTPTLAPSRTPAPTPTAFPTIPPAGVPDPKISAAERFDGARSQLAAGLGLAKEKIQISYCTLKGIQGNTMVYAVANYSTVAGSQVERHAAPLLVAVQTPGGGWEWNRVGFRVLGDSANLQIGVMMDTTAEYLLDDEFNFSLLTSGWGESTQPQSPDSIQFGHEDYHLGLARKHGIVDGRLMHLIFGHRSIPAWVQTGVKDGSIGRDQLIERMRNYITTMVKRYGEQGVTQFVVVNEPYRTGDLYAQVIGPDYIEIAFQAARDADPNALLLVNETDNHTSKGSFTRNTLTVLERLKKSGFDMSKIAVGVQAHIWQNQYTPPPAEDDVVKTLRAYRQTYGVDVFITEMDVNMRLFSGNADARFKAQAEIYRSFIRAALNSGVVKGIGFWTPIDQLSWYVFPQLDPEGSPNSVAGLWEGQPTDLANPYINPFAVSPKPSYYAVLEELFRHLLEQNGLRLPEN